MSHQILNPMLYNWLTPIHEMVWMESEPKGREKLIKRFEKKKNAEVAIEYEKLNLKSKANYIPSGDSHGVGSKFDLTF